MKLSAVLELLHNFSTQGRTLPLPDNHNKVKKTPPDTYLFLAYPHQLR